MSALGIAGSLAGTAVKTAVNRSINQYQERRLDQQSKVDWEDYNYPPYLNVLHYNSDDIENPSARAAVRLAHVSYLYTLSLFLLNLLGTIILSGGGAVDAVNVVYTLFNVIIYSIVGMYAFYCGYKGMATRNGRLTDYYVWLQSFFVLFQLITSAVNGANYYGWSNAGRARRSEKMSDFFLGWTFFESTMWTLGYLLGAAALYRVVTTRKDAMRSQGASGYGLRV